MMSQDNRLIPVSAIERGLDRPLSDLAPAKPYGTLVTETNIKDYLYVVLKRKWLILSLTLVVTSLVTIQMFRQPSIYQAETTIRIEPKPRSVLQTKELVINGGADSTFWGTQLKRLENNSLARQVVLTLDLQHNPNFFGGQSQGGVFSSLRRVFSREKKAAASAQSPTNLNIVGENELKEQQWTAEQLAELEPYEDTIIANETVEPVVGTSLVVIKYLHTDPELAQKIANTLAQVFVDNNLERATYGSTKAEDLLAKEVARLQREVKQGQEEQFNYAREHNVPLTSDPGSNIEAQRLAMLSSQLWTAENELKNLQSAYEAASHASDPYTIPEVQTSDRIAKLRERISALKEREDSLLVVYTKEWPEVKRIEAQLKPLEEDLKRAPAEVVAGMKSRYESAQSRVV